MTNRHHTGPWAHPPKRQRRALIDRMGFWALVALVALLAALIANKAIPQAAFDAVNHEVIR